MADPVTPAPAEIASAAGAPAPGTVAAAALPTPGAESTAPVAHAEPAPAAAVEQPAVAAEVPAAAAAPAADAKPATAAEMPSLLEEAKAPGEKTEEKSAEAKTDGKEAETKPGEKTEAKPAEAKADDKKADAKPGEKPAEAPVVVELPKTPAEYFTKLELPEQLKSTKPDDPNMVALTTALHEGGVSPEIGQKLVNLHADAMQQYNNQLRQEQQDAFMQTRRGWQKQLMADPEFGGAGFQTASGAIARMRDMFVSDAEPGSEQHKKEVAEWADFSRYTGAGDHPALWRLLHNVSRAFDEPQGARQDNPKPPPGNGKPPGRRGKVLYDNPRSQPGRA